MVLAAMSGQNLVPCAWLGGSDIDMDPVLVPGLSTAYSLILSPDPGLRPAPGQAGWYGGDSALALNPVFTQRHLAGQQWNLEGKLVMPLMPTKLVGTA